jgi:short subunit dehydrogenase-like uncharacterized protein
MVGPASTTGTDYCDLTGEVQWVRRMIERHEAAARASGARIVHCCGFDSIPSDLGVHFVQREAQRRFGAPCTRIKMRVKAMRGGASGGTVASLMNVVKEAASDPALRKELADPYSLCPPSGSKVRQPEVRMPEYDADFGKWVAPFVMALVNTRVVHRSNALSGHAYGADFVYDEAMITGSGPLGGLAAAALTAGVGGFVAASAIGPLRAGLERFVLPKPGEGPSPRRSATASSTCASSAPPPRAGRSGPRSPATAIPATARPARCSARPPRASRSTSTRPRRAAASGRRPRPSATGWSSG